MSKAKRGTSNDEKLNLLEKFFYERANPYSIKELENIVPKNVKEIKFPLVKDLVQQLVADGRIEQDKVGASNIYWLFPSQAGLKKKRKRDDLAKEVEELKAKKAKLESDIEEAQAGKEDSEERRQNVKTMRELEDKKQKLNQELSKYAEFDPELLQKIKDDVKTCREAVERWNDNIYTLQKIFREQFHMSTSDFNKQFGLPEELDI